MSITAEQQATLARIAARQREFAALSIGDGHRLATRQAARKAHRADMKARRADRRALAASEGSIWLVPTDPVPAPRKRAGKPIPFTPTGR